MFCYVFVFYFIRVYGADSKANICVAGADNPVLVPVEAKADEILPKEDSEAVVTDIVNDILENAQNDISSCDDGAKQAETGQSPISDACESDSATQQDESCCEKQASVPLLTKLMGLLFNSGGGKDEMTLQEKEKLLEESAKEVRDMLAAEPGNAGGHLLKGVSLEQFREIQSALNIPEDSSQVQDSSTFSDHTIVSDSLASDNGAKAV